MLKEYRIPLPLSVEEYHIAQLFMTARASEQETGDGEGIEVVKNEPLDCPKRGKCQYTLKKIHIASRIPRWLRAISSGLSKLCMLEESWNQYPICETRYTCDYLGDRFSMVIHTKHTPDNGTEENIHNLDKKKLKELDVVTVDIRDHREGGEMYDPKLDPNKFVSEKTGRGPLTEDWKKTADPVMCCYKLVDVKFKWWGLQTRVEKYLHGFLKDIFTSANANAYCWVDQWHGMTMEDIRNMEAKTAETLAKAIHETPAAPTTPTARSEDEQKHVAEAGAVA